MRDTESQAGGRRVFCWPRAHFSTSVNHKAPLGGGELSLKIEEADRRVKTLPGEWAGTAPHCCWKSNRPFSLLSLLGSLSWGLASFLLSAKLTLEDGRRGRGERQEGAHPRGCPGSAAIRTSSRFPQRPTLSLSMVSQGENLEVGMLLLLGGGGKGPLRF